MNMASGTSAGRALPLQQILTLLSTADLDEAKKASGENESDSLDFAEAIPYVLILMDEFLIYTYWNKAAEDLTGVPADQAIGRSFYEIFPQARGTVAETVYEEVLATGQPQGFDTESHLCGEHRSFEVSVYPFGEGLAVFGKDISVPKQPRRSPRDHAAIHNI